jgi:hypothetical protein
VAVHTTVCTGLVIVILSGWTATAGTLYVWQGSPNPTLPYTN